MKEVIVKTYEYKELDTKVQERVRNWYRENCMDGDTFWSDCVTEDFSTILKMCGWTETNFYWSGFCSQGDGACFDGIWHGYDVDPDKLAKDCPDEAECIAICRQIKEIVTRNEDCAVSVKHEGHYQHSRCTRFVDLADKEMKSDDFDYLVELSRDLMNILYHKLEDAYDWETSDESVIDNIVNNDWTFTKDGRLFGD